MRLALVVLAAMVLFPAGAEAATTYYVNQSAPAADDTGSCLTMAAPCKTIQAAVDKAEAFAGSTVQVVSSAPGTTTTYNEAVTLAGTFPITLAGAGSSGTVTKIETSTGNALKLTTGSTVRDLAATYTGTNNVENAILSSNASAVFERVVATAPESVNDFAFLGAGTVRDSTLSGKQAAGVLGARLVRTRIDATWIGAFTQHSSADLIDCIVVGHGTAVAGVAVDGSYGSADIRMRHVTVTGFADRAYVHPTDPYTATLEAANSTIAGDSGNDVHLVDGGKAVFTAVNYSESRKLLEGDGNEVQASQPLDVLPGLTEDGHLAPGSALIDRGTTGGVLAGDPEDGFDIDGQARAQGPAPDVGADEVVPPPPAPPAPIPDTDDPGVGLGGPRVQRLRRRSFYVFATSDENGEFRASARITVPRTGASAVIRPRRVTAAAVAGRRTKLVFKLSRKAARRVRRALRVRRRLTVSVKVVAADAAGNPTTARRKLKLRR